MAKRFVYRAITAVPFVKAEEFEFTWFSGFSKTQKQRSIESLHNSFLERNPGLKVLEASTKGKDELGNRLSAFNLELKEGSDSKPVEVLFQGSKVFKSTMSGQIYQPVEIYDMSPYEAKTEMRKYTGGDTQDYELVRFSFRGKDFPLEPKDYFYNWLYIQALNCNPEMMSELIEYDAFTDIEFNPERQFNCQAIACAIYVGLTRSGLLDEALKSPEDFLRVVYGG